MVARIISDSGNFFRIMPKPNSHDKNPSRLSRVRMVNIKRQARRTTDSAIIGEAGPVGSILSMVSLVDPIVKTINHRV